MAVVIILSKEKLDVGSLERLRIKKKVTKHWKTLGSRAIGVPHVVISVRYQLVSG